MYNHRRRHDCGANHEINESDLNRKKLYRMIVLRTFLLLVIFGCIERDVVSFRFLGQFPFGVLFLAYRLERKLQFNITSELCQDFWIKLSVDTNIFGREP